MDQETKLALASFFEAQAKLAQLGIIRSFRYAEDISHYLAQEVYGFMPKPRQPAGYDGTIGNAKVRVRFNNCPHGRKVMLQEPFEFDELIVVLGPTCALQPDPGRTAFSLYRFTRAQVREQFQTPTGHYIGDRALFGRWDHTRMELD